MVHVWRSPEKCQAVILQEMKKAFLIQSSEEEDKRGAKQKQLKQFTNQQMQEVLNLLYHNATLSPNDCSKLEISKACRKQRTWNCVSF